MRNVYRNLVKKSNLLFTCWNLVRVDVICLEGGVAELYRHAIKAVGTRRQDRNLEFLKHIKRGLASVIWSTVPDEDRIAPPMRPFSIQTLYQIVQEDLYDLGVRVCLHQAEVELAFGIKAQEE